MLNGLSPRFVALCHEGLSVCEDEVRRRETDPWFAAVELGDLSCITEMLACGTDVNNQNDCGKAALMCACANWQIESIPLLIASGPEAV